MAPILKTILEILGVVAAGTLVVKLVVKSRKSTVNQKNNVVHGDQAGRDIHK